MVKKENNGRHGSAASSGADSWRSTDTITPSFASRFRGTPVKVSTNKEQKADKDTEISPGSKLPNSAAPYSASADIAPWETARPSDLGNHRQDLSVLDNSGGKAPSYLRQGPSAPTLNPPWISANGSAPMPSSVFGSFYNDSSEDFGQMSPGFRPNGGEIEGMNFPGDDRRPSIASATTVSSTGSKSSVGRGFHKKLHNIFGEDPTAGEPRQDSNASTVTSSTINGSEQASRMRNRNNSVHNTIASSFGSTPGSPASSRPRTPGPQPSSEVTPWAFQDFKDVPAPPDGNRYNADQQSNKPSKTTSHKLHLPHRHTRSKDDSKPFDTAPGYTLQPITSREDSAGNSRRNDPQAYPPAIGSALNSKNPPAPRSSSPSGSMKSAMSRETLSQKSPVAPKSGKRSIFDKLRGRDKGERSGPDNLKDLPSSSVSLQSSINSARVPKIEAAPQAARKRDAIVDDASSQRGQARPTGKDAAPAKREHGRRLPFKSTKSGLPPKDYPAGKDPNQVRADVAGNNALWNLDTDLNHMEGIINAQQALPLTTPPASEIYTGWPGDDTAGEQKPPDGAAGAWDAPDSWAVKKVQDENISRLRELDEAGNLPKDEDPGIPYYIRVFRTDSTFAVLSLGLNTTVSEIIQVLGKKTHLQDELDNYLIVMRKHDTSKQLDPQERPLVIQKRLLEQAGYTEADHLDEIGREDNSYLCRFTFMPAKMSGYSSLDKDPGFSKMQKFSHIDLQGRNLITIPITLYQKATEIISLNLSRNLSLDVPKDFIQACSNLREIKYTSNEAWRLPPSLSLASKLTMLDVSNNRLEQLEHAELHRLQSLVSLRLSNNKLSSLPKYFGQYTALRSLNLSSNSLQEFPDFLCDIQTLVDLDISFNSISSIPRIGQLVNLERLWATNNKLTGSFPPTFSNLVNLREIDVRFNALANIDVMSQLPSLEYLMVGHNSISAFEGSFEKIRVLHLNHNPVTRFGMAVPVPTLSQLNLASAKLAQLPEDLFGKLSGLTKLVLDKNHFVSMSPQIGRLVRLEHLSIARNDLSSLPPDIGRLAELRYLDVRENSLSTLPAEIWFARRLETLNVSSNVLDSFPKLGPIPAHVDSQIGYDGATAQSPGLSQSPSYEELGKLEDFAARRPSQASGSLLSVSSSPAASQRTGSIASSYVSYPRKGSVLSRVPTDASMTGTITPLSRKDSTLMNRMVMTFAGSLRHLFLADNRLQDDVFEQLQSLSELRIVNLSYNEIYEIPSRTIRRWQHLVELYLSGNDLTSLPSEDLEETSSLRVLHINCNKFQTLPAELGKVSKLAILDVGNNALKYNVSNWPYDWNWNWNRNLKFLNLSGNKRLEIKPSGSQHARSRDGKDLTDFTSLTSLRVLGLMDVTLMVPSVPDQSEDRRIRTSGSMVGSMAYGMADSLGRNEHLSTMDMVVPRFRSHEDEVILGMFDGQALSSGGSKIAKYLYDNFKNRFTEELDKLRPEETAGDALRRTYLGLNKDLATTAMQALDSKSSQALTAHRGSIISNDLGDEDLKSGSVATVMFLKEMELFVSNVGDAQALLIHSEGSHRVITRKHDPAEQTERARIREAGGFVSRQGKLNDVLEVSRAFGYINHSPSVIAAPHIAQITLRESDEMVLLASRELWEYLTPDFAVDVARSERGDLMRAAQKLRDLAIAFGATSKITVMILGVSDLRKRERARFRTHSMSMGPSGSPDEFFASRTKKRGRDAPLDSKLARLDQEVEAPTGDVSLVFTDIKNSTMLWETYPIAMRSAIKQHNELMRRQLRIIGGYEVKTEGDAFMVAFPTVPSALLWCFTIQSQLLEVPWPQEILNSVNGQEVRDADGNVIFRGLSVRMGIHWGQPVCEVDPVTKRMDYFGPMVNRAARISSVADGGQITVSSDFIAEIQRLLETHIESDRTGSTGSDDSDEMMNQTIRRELRSLMSQGFEVKDLGERRLKGLENPEYIYLMYPHSLASRLAIQQQRAEAEKQEGGKDGAGTKMRDSQLTIDTENVWDLWNVSLRLEMLCSALESPGSSQLKPPETALLERMKNKGGEITDRFLLNFVEHQISRIETCITTLALRNMFHPFCNGMLQNACPMSDIFSELTSQLSELQALKEAADFEIAGA